MRTLWYSCYIDLFKGYGVGSSFVEFEDQIKVDFYFKQNSTINELNLYGVLLGLINCSEGSDIHIVGMSRYIDEALHRLGNWIKKDELDLKSHSHLWKMVNEYMSFFNKVTTKSYTSRRNDPMLWITSQASKDHFLRVQEIALERKGFPENECRSYPDLIPKDKFLKMSFDKPLTDLQMEKKIQIKARDSIKSDPSDNGVCHIIPFKK